jgi:hypothetical protein
MHDFKPGLLGDNYFSAYTHDKAKIVYMALRRKRILIKPI